MSDGLISLPNTPESILGCSRPPGEVLHSNIGMSFSVPSASATRTARIYHLAIAVACYYSKLVKFPGIQSYLPFIQSLTEQSGGVL